MSRKCKVKKKLDKEAKGCIEGEEKEIRLKKKKRYKGVKESSGIFYSSQTQKKQQRQSNSEKKEKGLIMKSHKIKKQ